MSYAPLPTSGSPPPPLGAAYSGLPWTHHTTASTSTISSLTHTRHHSILHRLRSLFSLRLVVYTVGLLSIVWFGYSAGRGGAADGAVASVRSLGRFADIYKFGWSPNALGREEPSNDGLMEPTWTTGADGLQYPPTVYPADLNPFQRANAALVVLVRNSEKDAIASSMRSLETKFNSKHGYPWVFMNDEPFTEEFKRDISRMTRHEVIFAQIPKSDWSYPEWVNQTQAREGREAMVRDNVIYGGSESYRHMCRFNSGFFYKQDVLKRFDWYWRVEPGDYDPFLFMERNKKVYGWTMAMYEYGRTIESLWPTVKEFARLHPEYIAEGNSVSGFMIDDERATLDESTYNMCHFWSNFEIADLRFWRSPAYEAFFDHLDKTGNFFYERWGDAPVHSIAAALFLPATAIHHFGDISYSHNPYQTCPQDIAKYHDTGKCQCDPKRNFDYDGYSCMRQWDRVKRRIAASQA